MFSYEQLTCAGLSVGT